MKVLLTGATGFVGSHVARFLQGRAIVYALVRPGSSLWRLEDVVVALRIVRGDLASREQVKSLLAEIRPDVCIHLAWLEAVGGYLDGPGNVDALVGSLDLVRELAAIGCRRILIAGTCAEYDLAEGHLSESSPTRPRNLYAATKHALHLVAEQALRATGTELAWLRFFSLYGPFEDERRLVPSIILSLLRNDVAKVSPGAQVRDYLYVEDAVEALWAVATSGFSGAINIAAGRPVSVGEIATTIGSILDRRELVLLGGRPYRTDEPMFVCARIERLRALTEWTPRVDLSSGLRETIEWWKDRTTRHAP